MNYNAAMKLTLRVVFKIFALLAATCLLLADSLVWLMLIRRHNERTIQPTKRVSWPQGLKRELMRRQDSTCAYCGNRRIARNLEIDHMYPVVRGGSNDKDNLQVLCRPCNQRKGMQTDEEFRHRYRRIVPRRRLTPPKKPVPQSRFSEETERTAEAPAVWKFRRTRYISARRKIVTGCLFLSMGVGCGTLIGLAQLGLEGMILALPPALLGPAIGLSVGIRAFITGATSR